MPYDRELGSTDPHPHTPGDGATVAHAHGNAPTTQPDPITDTITDSDAAATITHTFADRDVAATIAHTFADRDVAVTNTDRDARSLRGPRYSAATHTDARLGRLWRVMTEMALMTSERLCRVQPATRDGKSQASG
jgi:hypothetical protein